MSNRFHNYSDTELADELNQLRLESAVLAARLDEKSKNTPFGWLTILGATGILTAANLLSLVLALPSLFAFVYGLDRYVKQGNWIDDARRRLALLRTEIAEREEEQQRRTGK